MKNIKDSKIKPGDEFIVIGHFPDYGYPFGSFYKVDHLHGAHNDLIFVSDKNYSIPIHSSFIRFTKNIPDYKLVSFRLTGDIKYLE